MEHLNMIALYAGIAAVLYLLFGKSRWFRRMLGNRDLGEKPRVRSLEDRQIAAIASSGGGLIAQETLGRRTHVTTWGMRLLTTALSLVMIYIGSGMLIADFGSGALHGDGQAWFWGIIAIAVYINAHIWLYNVSHDGTVLTNMNWLFRYKEFNLNDLVSVEDSGTYLYRLGFADGQSAEVQKFVTGQKELRQMLEEVLRRNKEG